MTSCFHIMAENTDSGHWWIIHRDSAGGTTVDVSWVLSHWVHFTVLRFIFVYVRILCISVYCM